VPGVGWERLADFGAGAKRRGFRGGGFLT